MNYHLIKRLFDYVSSAIGLMLLTPLFIPIILILKFTSEGEIFTCKKRIAGKQGLWYDKVCNNAEK
ncbi:MAG: sugar transferase [Saprospiraceae bacterium]|nr:sugar transferase [Saprospiraceae bacterium]